MTTTQNARPASQQTTDYHWVMSVQHATGMNTRDAIATVPTGSTRRELFQFIVQQFINDYGLPITVLFFEAQPNKL